MTHDAQQPIEDSSVRLPADRTGPSISSVQRLFETIPDDEISLYQDLINSGRGIMGPLNTEPPRKRITSQIYDDTTPWFETGDSAFMLGLISRSARRGLIAVQNQFGPQTPNESEDIDRFFDEHGENIPDALRRRKVAGRYDGTTKEAMLRLMAYDLTMDLYQEKVDKGSKWAAGFATAADIVILEGLTLGALNVAPIVGGAAAAGKTIVRAGRGVRSGLKLSKPRSVTATSQTLRQGRSRELTKALSKKRVKSPTAPDANIPPEAAAVIGNLAGRTGASVADTTNLLARAWGFNSVKGATLTGGGVFLQEGGIKLLDDERTWGEIAQDTALAAAAGGVIGFVVPFTTNIIRSFGDDAARVAEKTAKASKGVKPIFGKSKIRVDEAGVIIADVSEKLTLDPRKIFTADLLSSFLRNPVTLVGMKFERLAGRVMIRGGLSEKVAQFWASIARPLVWGGSVYGLAAAFGLAPSNFGAEGMADKMKQYIAKEVAKKILNEDIQADQAALPIGDPTELLAAISDVAPNVDLFNVKLGRDPGPPEGLEELLLAQVDTNIAQGILPSPAPVVATEIDFPEGADRSFFDASVELAFEAAKSIENFTLEEVAVQLTKGFDAMELEIREDQDIKNFVSVTAELALSAHAPLADTFLLAGREINEYDHSPEQLREFAAAYRSNVDSIMLGDTIGDILLDQSYRVVEEHDLVAEQAELERGIMNEIGHINQTYFTGSLDENGLAAAGNMTSRIFANSMATFLEAKADGTLPEELKLFQEDSTEWMRKVSASSLEKFAMNMQVQRMTSIEWVGRYIDSDDQEKLAQETMLMAYSEAMVNRLVSDELTADDEDILSGLNYVYMANFLSTYQTILVENVSGQQNNKPSHQEIHHVKNALAVPLPVQVAEPTDVPEFTEELASATTDIPSFEP